jgi:hypothetical protein
MIGCRRHLDFDTSASAQTVARVVAVTVDANRQQVK